MMKGKGLDVMKLDQIEMDIVVIRDLFYFGLCRFHKELSKEDVHGLFERTFDIARPQMYEMGYPNNNCIGCVKGGMGYWNRIKKDFPDVFESRAKLERLVGYSILKDGNGTPIYLDELEPDRGNMNTEIFPDCSIMCYLAEKQKGVGTLFM